MRTTRTILTLAVVMAMAGPVLADWDPGDDYKMHYPQLPDLEFGLDVLDGPRVIPGEVIQEDIVYSKFLADDFLCMASGPITDIHIWSSYNHNTRLPDEALLFNLAIYSDIPDPDGSGPQHSMPGELLWSDYRQADVERVYRTNVPEKFYDPNMDMIIGSDWTVYQYNFLFDPLDPGTFQQEEGTVYWLGVNRSADINGDGFVDVLDLLLGHMNPDWAFGWKTSQDHWNDDAVWTDLDLAMAFGGTGEVVGEGPWAELIDPRNGESLDLAFVITPEPATMTVLAIGALAVLARRRRR